MKLYHKGYYIKYLPVKFRELANVCDYLECEQEKRLTPTERRNLEEALFCQRVELTFLSQFRRVYPLEAEQIGDTMPVQVTRIITNDGQQYFVLLFSNGVSVRCPGSLYVIAPVRTSEKYATGLAVGKIPPPGAEQLQLF